MTTETGVSETPFTGVLVDVTPLWVSQAAMLLASTNNLHVCHSLSLLGSLHSNLKSWRSILLLFMQYSGHSTRVNMFSTDIFSNDMFGLWFKCVSSVGVIVSSCPSCWMSFWLCHFFCAYHDLTHTSNHMLFPPSLKCGG